MLPKRIMLNEYEPHPYRQTINDFGIQQFDLAYTIGVPQSSLSKMLRGIASMPQTIENEIKSILEGLQEPKPTKKKHKKIVKPTKA